MKRMRDIENSRGASNSDSRFLESQRFPRCSVRSRKLDSNWWSTAIWGLPDLQKIPGICRSYGTSPVPGSCGHRWYARSRLADLSSWRKCGLPLSAAPLSTKYSAMPRMPRSQPARPEYSHRYFSSMRENRLDAASGLAAHFARVQPRAFLSSFAWTTAQLRLLFAIQE